MARYEVFCNALYSTTGNIYSRDADWSVIVGPNPEGIFYIALPSAGSYEMAKEAADALNAAAEREETDGNPIQSPATDSSGW